jgi:hypothetical protein
MTGDHTASNSNPRVTMRLTEAGTRHYIRIHSDHFTYAAARRIIGELVSGYGRRQRTKCARHGATCLVVYDAGEHMFYIMTMPTRVGMTRGRTHSRA